MQYLIFMGTSVNLLVSCQEYENNITNINPWQAENFFLKWVLKFVNSFAISMLKSLINGLYRTRFLVRLYGRIFHSFDYCFFREIKECSSVLDLGCGSSSPLQNCKKNIYSVGVDAYLPYIKESERQKIHNKYIHKRIEEVDFPPRSFDAVVIIEVLEHLPKKLGLKIIKKAEKWAKKKIIVSTPNGFLHQKGADKNVFQKHLSGWTAEEMERMGFKSYGFAGLKFLRGEDREDRVEGDIITSSRIKYHPIIFWMIMAALSQFFVYYLPSYAFELFCVRRFKYGPNHTRLV